MAVKSIIDIDLNDSKFRAFQAMWSKYDVQLKNQPKVWDEVRKTADKTKKSFDAIVALLVAQNKESKQLLAAQKQADWITAGAVGKWQIIANRTDKVLGNVRNITNALLRWPLITAGISGLVGAGGIFGLDRLAANIGAGRRSAQGLGIGYGEQKAFDLNFDRLVDTGSFLTNVSEALRDVTKRYGFYGAGLGESQLRGSTGEVGASLIQSLKKIADQTPVSQLAQVLHARGLDQFVSVQDLQRLKATSPAELAGITAGYRNDVGALGLAPDLQRRWQDFNIQLGRAGQRIETTFIRGLDHVEKPLMNLSIAFEKVVQSFLKNDIFAKWLDEVGEALNKFAGYVGTDDFQKNVHDFVNGIAALASGTVKVLKFMGIVPGGEKRTLTTEGYVSGMIDIEREAQAGRPLHNPGNLRIPGSTTGFQQFGSDEEGIRAMARQLKLYADRDHLDTISGIVNKYAPASENDVASYVNDVTKRTGFSATQHLDLNDKNTLAALISAMTKHENVKSDFSAGGVKLIIENRTGGNAVVSTNQLAQQP